MFYTWNTKDIFIVYEIKLSWGGSSKAHSYTSVILNYYHLS